MRWNFWKSLALPAAALCILATGCGEGGREPEDTDDTAPVQNYGTDSTGAAYVGADVCINCHQSITWSAGLVTDYLGGSHAGQSSHVDVDDPECLRCHDPVGDGHVLTALNGGMAAMTCEGCHGAGGKHYGTGPLANPYPDYKVCGGEGSKCHSALPDNHLPYHPEGPNVLERYQSSAHYNGGVASHASTKCTRCHTDEGARKYINITAADTLASAVQTPDMATSPIQCRTCHNAHDPGELLRPATSTASAEYNTCAYCHQSATADLNAANLQRWTDLPTKESTDGGLVITTGSSAGTTVLLYHAQRYERIIASYHYDSPLTTNKIEGFVVKSRSDRACRDCHDVHSTDLTVQKEWASSAHGGFISHAKEEAAAGQTKDTLAQTQAVQAAGVVDNAETGAPGWTHYDWDSSSRQSCQRCHTATGAKNFLDNPAGYVDTNNDFSHLSGWSITTSGSIVSSGQNELLYCWACHSDGLGGLRDPGALSFTGSLAYTNGATAEYPDVKGSNICIACHSGRETGDSIKLDPDADGVRSFINSHYLAAGGTVFATTGYEYAGRSYANGEDYAHDKIGTEGEEDTGTNGPCVGCHMSSTEKHHFLPVNERGKLTAQVCVTCHEALTAGSEEGSTWVESKKEEYAAALEALKAALASKGIHFYEAYPYFYNGEGGTGGSFTNWAGVYGLGSWKDTMGAAFNLNLLLHDPGAFAHNSVYAKRLIWDTIDFIDDGTLNHSVTATILALEEDEEIDAETSAAARGYLGATRPRDPPPS